MHADSMPAKRNREEADNISLQKELLSQPLYLWAGLMVAPTINHVNWFTDKMSVRAHSRSAAAPQLLFNLCPAIVHLFN